MSTSKVSSGNESKNNNKKHVKLASTEPLSSNTVVDSGNENYCVGACVEPLKDFGLGKCNHRSICSVDSIRRRTLYKQPQCPVCRLNLEHIILTTDKDKNFEDFDLKSMKYHEASQSYYGDDIDFNKIARLWEIRCPYCDRTDFASLDDLRKHTKPEHNLSFCEVCLENRKVFLQEQKLYSTRDLLQHMKTGDKDTLIKHEECKFCKLVFFDKDVQFNHLHQEHFTCWICDKDGILYQYYKDYHSLEEHFRKDHYPCDDPDCRAKRFIVFRSADDLRIHHVESHYDKIPKGQRKSARHIHTSAVSTISRDEIGFRDTPPPVVEAPQTNSMTVFPSLSEEATAAVNRPSIAANWGQSTRRINPDRDFPTLGGPAPMTNQVPSSSSAWGSRDHTNLRSTSTPSTSTTTSNTSNTSNSTSSWPSASSGPSRAQPNGGVWGSKREEASQPPQEVEEEQNKSKKNKKKDNIVLHIGGALPMPRTQNSGRFGPKWK